MSVGRWASRCFEDLGKVPFQELAFRPVGPALRQIDQLPGPGVEMIAVAEVLAQPGTNEQPILGIDADVSAVEQGMNVRPEAGSVGQSV